jgi:hypothetical protein
MPFPDWVSRFLLDVSREMECTAAYYRKRFPLGSMENQIASRMAYSRERQAQMIRQAVRSGNEHQIRKAYDLILH